MSAYLKLLEFFWPIHHCPENPLQKIILSLFWTFKISVSIYTKYDTRKKINRVRYLNGTPTNQLSNSSNLESLCSWIGLYSEENKDAYSNSSKITQLIVSWRYLWALISDIMHIVFIIMTLDEQKNMPPLSLFLYCLLICLDSVFSISLTKRFVKIFNSKTGLILANILLRFFFGPLESYLEFQYFGRTVEGFDKIYVVAFGAFISVFDLMREILEVKIDFRLMKNDLVSPVFNPYISRAETLHGIVRNFFRRIKPEKLVEVITFVNFTTFYLELFKIFFYFFSMHAMQDVDVASYSSPTNDHNECENISSVMDSINTDIIVLYDIRLLLFTKNGPDLNNGNNADSNRVAKTGLGFFTYVFIFICIHYILVTFVLFHRFTFKLENLLVNLFRVPVVVKQLFFFAAHSSLVLICYQYFVFFMESFKLLDKSVSFQLWWTKFFMFGFVNTFLSLYSIIWIIHALFLNFAGFTGCCVCRKNASITRLSKYIYSIFILIKNTDSDTPDSLNTNCLPSFVEKVYRCLTICVVSILFSVCLLVLTINTLFRVWVTSASFVLWALYSTEELPVILINLLGVSDIGYWFSIIGLSVCVITFNIVLNVFCCCCCKSSKERINLCCVLPIIPRSDFPVINAQV